MQNNATAATRLIWDLPTRVFHWALAGSFFGAYLLSEQDGLRAFHVMFGYTAAALIVFRLLWGFIGSRHSRFRDFAYGPGAALRHLRDLAAGRARDYDGHNPAGSWAIYGLIAFAAATAVTGWLHYNAYGGEAFEEIHEVLANAWLLLVAMHVAGVIVASLAHRRNLVATMVTGRRAVEGGAAGDASDPARIARDHRLTRPRWAFGSVLTAAVLGFWTWSVTTGGGPLLAGAEEAGSGRGHGERAERGSGAAQSGEHGDEDDD